MDDKQESSEDKEKSESETSEDERDTSETPLSGKPSETSKKRKITEKSYEIFEIPEDVREPTKSPSPEERIPFKTVREQEGPMMLQKSSRSREMKSVPQPGPAEKKSPSPEPAEEKGKSDDDDEEEEGEDKSGPDGTPGLKSALKSPTKENKSSPKKKKRRRSFVTFFTKRTPQEEPELPKPKRRPSYVRRKIMALEKELTLDKINKRVTRMFQPQPIDGDGDKERGKEEIKRRGTPALSSSMACMFLIAATTGSAIASLPFFLRISSWFGVFFNLLLGLNALYAGLCTGWCWSIMEEKWPEYLEYSRVPYQDIAYRAVGTWMKYIVALCVDVSILGSTAGYILMIADALENIYFEKISFCYTIIIFSVALTPFIMFGSYRHIKFIGVLDVLFSILFTLLLVVSFFLNKPFEGASTYTDPSYQSIFMSFAGFSFAYGTGAIIPSIMADMADRSLFNHTCATSYMICIAIYLIVPIMGYAAYGDKTPRFIIHAALTSEYYYILAVVISFIHILQLSTTYVVALMPTLHAFEVRVNCPHRFGIGRIIVRLSIVSAILVLILGIPYLPKFMDLVGATTMNLVTFIFPPTFYVCLIYGKESRSKKRTISKKEWILVAEILLLGICVGAMSTYMSVKNYETSPPNRISCFLSMNSTPEGKVLTPPPSWI